MPINRYFNNRDRSSNITWNADKKAYKKKLSVFYEWAVGGKKDAGIITHPYWRLGVYYWSVSRSHEESLLYRIYTDALKAIEYNVKMTDEKKTETKEDITKLYKRMCELCKHAPYDRESGKIRSRAKGKGKSQYEG